MTEELKQKNFDLYIKKLKQLGIDTDQLVESIGDKLKNATFSNTTESGEVGEGTLIDVVLKILTPYAVRINKLLPEAIQVDQNTLVKICLLHHIAKAVRLIPNDNQWEIEKRGMLYKYDSEQPSIRTGLHSMVIASAYGVKFTPEEAEGMVVNDRDATDGQAKWHSSILASIIREANELTYLQLNALK